MTAVLTALLSGSAAGAETHTFADAGHYVLEDAHERIVPLVADFLARHPLKPPAY